MQALRRTDDRIDRAGGDAQRTSDAAGVVDMRDHWNARRTSRAIERRRRAAEQLGERGKDRVPAGRAAVDLRRADGHRARVREARLVPAAAALRLGEQCIDSVHKFVDGIGRRHVRF